MCQLSVIGVPMSGRRHIHSEQRERPLGRFPDNAKPEPTGDSIDRAWSLIRQNRYGEAEGILKAHLAENPRNRETIATLIQLYSKTRKVVLAESTFDKADADGLLSPKLCSLMIRSYSGASELNNALAIFDIAEERNLLDPFVFSAAIDACRRHGALEDAEDVLKVAIEKKLADVVVYTAMIEFYGSEDQPDKALHLFRAAEVKPDKKMYMAV